jgi:hypothetical protein
MHRQSHACDPPANTDDFRPLTVSSQAEDDSAVFGVGDQWWTGIFRVPERFVFQS